MLPRRWRRYCSLEIVDSFRYFYDVISCGEGGESAARNRISCACSKWRELTSFLVDNSFPVEKWKKERWLTVCVCVCVRPALL